MARHKLRDLKLEEISLVDRPANKGAQVALWKRDGEVSLLQECDDGVLVMLPAFAGVEKGARLRAERPVADDHASEGEVLEVTDSGSAIAKFPRLDRWQAIAARMDRLQARMDKQRSEPISAATPTAASISKETTPMTRFDKALGHSRLGTTLSREEAFEAITEKAQATKQAGETDEMAFARVAKTREGCEINNATRKASEPVTPAKSHDTVSDDLERLAKVYADNTGMDLVQARAVVAKSKEGRELRARAMR